MPKRFSDEQLKRLGISAKAVKAAGAEADKDAEAKRQEQKRAVDFQFDQSVLDDAERICDESEQGS
mgnify:CR=1 FL=1|tara:strand:- start:330 stop:527 length:198 start_codon:yes stop_codon:yes gene_type:complete